jgi:hypothetical protein
MIQAATWFETRGVAAHLTMRVADLIPRTIAKRRTSRDEAAALENVFAPTGFHFGRAAWRR